MKLVEVVILAGTHCISPLQHADGLTDAGKVSCAVIVEKDSETNTVTVMPSWQAGAPEVRLAIGGRRNSLPGAQAAAAPELRIEPAAARPSPAAPPPRPEEPDQARTPSEPPPSVADVKTPVAANQPEGAAPDVTTTQPRDADQPDAEVDQNSKAQDRPTQVAALDSAPPKSQRTARAKSGECMGEARPAWYTNKDGRRKYRCVKPGKTKLY